jgi:hypothetical protein
VLVEFGETIKMIQRWRIMHENKNFHRRCL